VKEVEIDNVSDENNYKLVHASGRCSTKDMVSDERFTISMEDTVKIKRVVEVYQWHEKIEKNEEHTEYSYYKEWTQEYIN
jgi:hypothetical protein